MCVYADFAPSASIFAVVPFFTRAAAARDHEIHGCRPIDQERHQKRRENFLAAPSKNPKNFSPASAHMTTAAAATTTTTKS